MLERKLAISQAYADALRQAHDKCRQSGSHVEDTSSESAAVDLSAKYAQVSSFSSNHRFCFDIRVIDVLLHLMLLSFFSQNVIVESKGKGKRKQFATSFTTTGTHVPW